MKIIFSRKGFDSASGGGPSPILDGVPVSMPIPAMVRNDAPISGTTYGALGLGEAVARASRGKLGAQDFAHHDPMFTDGECLFGQVGAAQTHLANRGVGVGDVFVFFGLFGDGADRHHRIFAFLEVETMCAMGSCNDAERAHLAGLDHPHALAMHGANDVIYCGRGRCASRASEALRLTVPGGPPSLWRRPGWLAHGGLSYHDRPERWIAGPDKRLQSVARGQEFVADIGNRAAPRRWLDEIRAEIER